MNYDAVIFDLDGTLLDTLDDLGDSMNRVLTRASLATHPIEAYKLFVGGGASQLVRRALVASGWSGSEPEFDGLTQEFLAEYRTGWDVKTKPYDGILALLARLQERNVPTAVLSNKPDDFTQLCGQRFLSDAGLTIVRGAGPGTPHKPDPAGVLQVARELGVAPEKTLYVGDTSVDMQVAHAAGMAAVGVTWGFRTADELREHGAKILIDHPADLPGLL